jgi:P27 family predicted phage terminase small subunit
MRKLPTEIKEQQGTLEKSRILPGEVTYSRCEAVPEPPETLDTFGEKVWYTAAGELQSRNLLFKTDLPALEVYCVGVSFMRMAAKEIKDGTEGSQKTRMGNWFKYWKDSAEIVNKFGSKFGFSPVDKTNIAVPAMGNGQSLFK